MSPVLKNAWAHALEVSERDIDLYTPNTIDIRVCEALLAGCFTSTEMASFIGCTTGSVWRCLRNPVAAAWMSRQLQSHVQKRLGMVLASMFARAVGGDVGAARLILDRFGQIQSLSHVVHHKGLDVTKLSDDDLDLVLAGKLKETGTIIDVPAQNANTTATGEGKKDSVEDIQPSETARPSIVGGEMSGVPRVEPDGTSG